MFFVYGVSMTIAKKEAAKKCSLYEGDIWGYGKEAVAAVRAAAAQLPIIKQGEQV